MFLKICFIFFSFFLLTACSLKDENSVEKDKNSIQISKEILAPEVINISVEENTSIALETNSEEISKDFVKIGSDNLYDMYEGRSILNGKYRIENDVYLGKVGIYFWVTDESKDLLPKRPNQINGSSLPNSNVAEYRVFRIDSTDENLKLFEIDGNMFNNDSSLCIEGEASIEISSYNLLTAEVGASDTAKLERIISKKSFTQCAKNSERE